jgi:hypothetical protein
MLLTTPLLFLAVWSLVLLSAWGIATACVLAWSVIRRDG